VAPIAARQDEQGGQPVTTERTDRTDEAISTARAGCTDTVEAPRSGAGWWVWLLAPLLCLPCLLGAVGGVAAVTVSVGAVVGALTQNVVLSLLIGGVALTTGVGAAVVYLRRRAARACAAGACPPPPAARPPAAGR
jgi:hypothetical protein